MPTTTAQRRASGDTPRPATAGGQRANARRAASSALAADEWLTVSEVCTELKIGRRTFERWRSLGTAPRAKRLAGNGPLRVRRRWLNEWMEDGA
jgi:hypothetical protein